MDQRVHLIDPIHLARRGHSVRLDGPVAAGSSPGLLHHWSSSRNCQVRELNPGHGGKLNTTLDMEIEEAPTKEAEDFSVAKILLLGAELVGFYFLALSLRGL